MRKFRAPSAPGGLRCWGSDRDAAFRANRPARRRHAWAGRWRYVPKPTVTLRRFSPPLRQQLPPRVDSRHVRSQAAATASPLTRRRGGVCLRRLSFSRPACRKRRPLQVCAASARRGTRSRCLPARDACASSTRVRIRRPSSPRSLRERSTTLNFRPSCQSVREFVGASTRRSARRRRFWRWFLSPDARALVAPLLLPALAPSSHCPVACQVRGGCSRSSGTQCRAPLPSRSRTGARR